MKIAIIGLGWLGEPLAQRLSLNYQVVGSKRDVSVYQSADNKVICYPLTLPITTQNEEMLREEQQAKDNPVFQGLFSKTDCLIITLPASRNPSILENYTTCVKQLIKLANIFHIKHTLFTSSTSVYGETPGVYTESSVCRPVSSPGKVLLELEQWLLKTQKDKITILRLAGLAGAQRHPGRFFQDKEKSALLEGTSLVNFVHGEDVINAIEAIIEHIFIHPSPCKRILQPIYNLCAPIYPSRNSFYHAASQSLGLPPPIFKQSNANRIDFPFKYTHRIIDGLAITRELTFKYDHPNPLAFTYNSMLK